MGSLNKCSFIGRICNDPEAKQINDKTTIININLAVNEVFKNSNGERQEKTEFIRLVAFNHPANLINKYCHKGSQIYVDGKMQTREWTDKEGTRRFTTEVLVRNVQLLDSKRDNNGGQYQANEGEVKQSYKSDTNTQQRDLYDNREEFIEDSIPF